ncbi:MAG: SpoIIE family protein phosphatase [Bacteroidia bacterium]
MCYGNIGELYNDVGKYKLAVLYSDSELVICKEIGDIDGERQAFNILATAYSKTGKYKEAYESHVKFKTLTDSIFNADNSKQLGDLKTKFEVEKKEAELKIKAEAQEAIAQEEKQKQRMFLILVTCIMILVAVFAVFMYRRFKITQRQKAVIEKQKALVDVKNKEIEHQKKIVEEHHKDIIDSINYAERIQRSFIATKELLDEHLTLNPSPKERDLKETSPLSFGEGQGVRSGADYFVFFKPKDIVSGDFYWASKLSNGNFALATADSTGHGVPGAIMSLLNVTSLEKAIENNTQPADILNATRKIIIERLKKDGSPEGGKDGMDCSLIVFEAPPPPEGGINEGLQNPPSGGRGAKLIVAAANNPVWIVRGTETIEIKPDKMPVGKHDKQANSFTQQEIELKSGDVIYTLTDGFPDQFGGDKGKKFMSKNLRELLAANAHLPMQAQKELLDNTFINWVGNLEQVDDVTLIGVRV